MAALMSRSHVSALTWLAATLLTGATLSCSPNRIVGPHDLARLAAAESRWRERPFADYTYEIFIGCFCTPEVTRWTRVTVRNGVVVHAEHVEPQPATPITTFDYWHPIDTVFSRVRAAMVDRGSTSYLKDIVVQYDGALGYPTRVEFVSKPNIADGGATWELRNVTPLPPP